MNPFDHVGVLYSFIVSLGLAQVMTTFGALVKARRRVRFSGVFAVWLLIALASHVDMWLQLWDYRVVRDWTVLKVLILLAWAAILFLLTTLISPPIDDDGEIIDLKEFHRENGWIYISVFLAALAVSVLADGLVDPAGSVGDSLGLLVATLVIMGPWPLLAIFNRKRWAQWVGAGGTLAAVALSFATMDALS